MPPDKRPIGLEMHTYSVKITGAYSTSQNLDINIEISKRLWGQFVLVEFSPFLWVFNLEAREGIWVNHLVI